MYRRYHQIADMVFYVFAALFSGISLIRDCVVELWGVALINPFMMRFIFIMDWVILPVLALMTLFLEFKDNRKERMFAIFGLLLLLTFQLDFDYLVFMDPDMFINHLIHGSSFERGIWVYFNAGTCRWGLACLIVAAKGKDFGKIAWIYVISQTALMLVITALALTGVIPDMVFAEVGRPERHALGLHYPLNYVANWFSIALVYCYLRKGILKIWEYAGLIALLGISVFVCKAQTTSVLFFVLITGTFIRQMGWGRKLWRREVILKCLQYSFLFFAAFMILASLFYVPPISTALGRIRSLNTFLSRFAFGRTGLMEYFPTLLGVEYPISTWTGTTANEDYFFIDCSYIYELLHCGVLVYPLMMALLWYIPHRLYKKRQGYALCILALFACICAMEHHLADASFNIFWFMVFARLDDADQPRDVAALSSSSKSTS